MFSSLRGLECLILDFESVQKQYQVITLPVSCAQSFNDESRDTKLSKLFHFIDWKNLAVAEQG